MRIDILTIFPEIFGGYLGSSLIAKAQAKGLVTIRPVDLRQFATGKHREVDDAPYGGGAGMVFMVEPVYRAVQDLVAVAGPHVSRRVVLLSPQGVQFAQTTAQEFAKTEHLILICGRYKGVDERVKALVVTDELSIGDYVLNGGEAAAMVVVDAVFRLLPGALGKSDSAETDSVASGLLEYPVYTRPEEFLGQRVPEILLSGHHEEVRKWRRTQALRRTKERRPDLFGRFTLTDEDRELLQEKDRDKEI